MATAKTSRTTATARVAKLATIAISALSAFSDDFADVDELVAAASWSWSPKFEWDVL